MGSIMSSCSAVPSLPVSGGGAAPVQSPVQAPIQGGGASGAPQGNPLQPDQSAAVAAASGGGALVQAPAPVAPAAAPAAPEGAATVTGGGAVDPAAIIPVLQQLVATLTSLVGVLQSQLGGAQAQAGAAGVQGGGEVPAGSAPQGSAPAIVETPAGDPVAGGGGAGAAAATCCCGSSEARAIGETVGAGGGDAAAAAKDAPADEAKLPEAPPLPAEPAATGGGAGKLDGQGLTVKGKPLDATQRANLEAVLTVGKEMGANTKVMETAVSTVIQESVARNDSSVDSKDLDSLGLFQQRPSQGWGTREQIADPKYAARKFFEQAIPNDAKDPGKAKTALAQSVQRSGLPDAYAKWDAEAAKIVADFNS